MPTAIVALLLGLLVGVSTSAASPVLRWERPFVKLLVGETATLGVVLDDTLDVRTFEVRVAFDPAIIASVEGGPGAAFAGLDLYQDFALEDDGVWHGYCVVLGADEWAVGPGELFTWTVTATSEGSSPLTAVDLGLRPPGGGDYPDVALPTVGIDVGDVTAADAPPDAPLELRLSPNPFNPRVTIDLRPVSGAVAASRLEVLDARGRRVALLWSADDGGGLPSSLAWDGRDAAGRSLSSGVYLFRLAGPAGHLALQRGTLLR
jgi:hypothetical protein